jgi:uncharacterized protein (DUF58 family)
VSAVSSPRSVITLRGAFLLSAAAISFSIGIARVDGTLAAMGILVFLLVPLSAWLGKRNVRNTQLYCQAATRTYAGQRFPIQLRVESPDALSDLRFTIQLPGQFSHTCEFDRVPADVSEVRNDLLELPRRGESRELPYRLESDFPLGIWKHTCEGVIAHGLCVYPRPLISKKLTIPGLWRDATAMAGATYGAMAGEIRGLRPWRAGDSLKRIHPAASVRAYARGTGLIVAETDPPGFFPQHVTVLFHSYAGDRAIIRPEMFEKALSYLCGTLRTLWQQSIPATLIADFDGWLEHPCRSRKDLAMILERLARVQRQQGTELHEFQQAQRMLEADSSLIMISDMPVADWRSALVPRRVSTLVLPVNPTTVLRGKPQPTKR